MLPSSAVLARRALVAALFAGFTACNSASPSSPGSDGGASASSSGAGASTTSAAERTSASEEGHASSSEASARASASSADPCAGTPVFCDDFTKPGLAADYTFSLGAWTRSVGSLGVVDTTAWDRPRATLSGVAALSGASNFDLTFRGATLGDPGIGVFWGSAASDDGYAVLVHPGTYQGIFLKHLVPGQNDVNLANTALPAGLGGTRLTVRVTRVGSLVTVWLNGTQMLSASDGAGDVTGHMGLLLSNTSMTSPSDGASWTLLRVDQAGPYAGPGDGGAPDAPDEDAGHDGGTTDDGGCTGGPPAGTTPMPVGVAGSWTLAFDDEFGGAAIDSTRWGVRTGSCNNDVSCSTSNVSVGGGCMSLFLASSTSGAEVCTDSTCGAGANAYDLPVGGYAEARVRFPGSGTTIYNWPAWWVSGPNWPAAGEEDIAEGLGQLTTNYHAPNVTDNSGPIPGTWSNQFHVYGMWRQATQALYYWDGNLVYTWTTSDDGQPQTLIVNVGCSDPSTCVTGAASEVDVDYVRAWQ